MIIMMEEIPKLDSACCSNSGCGVALESEEKSMNDAFHFQYTADKADDDDDSFVIDMDSFSSALNKDNTTNNANSRIITRSLSRKWSQRKMNGNATLHDMDVIPAIGSPKATVAGSCAPEKPAVMAVGSADSINPHIHHQIAITANSSSTSSENKSITRRNSFRRSSSWTLDPKRVLLLFATLSSMGTMVLIFFTFIINKQNADHEYGGD